MNMITRLLSYQPFLDRVARDIREHARGQKISVQTPDGEVTGEIKEVELIGSPLFADEGCDCVGNTCSLPFPGRAHASGNGEAGNGNHVSFFRPVEYFGQVDLSWPDDGHVRTQADFQELFPDVTVNVVVESIGGEETAGRPQKTATVPGL